MDGPASQILKPSVSGRRRGGGDMNSPEFEFWMVGNPSCPQPNLHSADELFSDGVLLPLHLLRFSGEAQGQDGEAGDALAGSDQSAHKLESSDAESARLSANSNPLTSSKLWREMFRKGGKKGADAPVRVNFDDRSSGDVKERRREKRSSGSGASAAELNINIWPFSRSRSAGNGGSRPRVTSTARKASSAPCSRSNSAGESKSRKWPSSPARAAGIPVGRSSPVWQVPRRGGGRNTDSALKNAEKIAKNNIIGRRKIPALSADGSKARVFSLTVPMCIGYRGHLSCKNDGNIAAAGGGVEAADEGVRGSNLFTIRNLFTKKVY